MPVAEATHALIAPLLFQALHRHSVGACPVMGPDMSLTRLLDTQFDLMLHGLMAHRAGVVHPPAPVRRAVS